MEESFGYSVLLNESRGRFPSQPDQFPRLAECVRLGIALHESSDRGPLHHHEMSVIIFVEHSVILIHPSRHAQRVMVHLNADCK